MEINHASEIDEIFDAISYRKGASVIRMLQSYLGAECFQVGFVCYMYHDFVSIDYLMILISILCDCFYFACFF